MSANEKFTEEQLNVLAKVEKLLRLAAKNQNEHEAAAASSKAMELLAAYNLESATIDIEGSDSGKRAQEELMGGFYQFERDLWRSISDLNFIWYYTQTKFLRTDEDRAGHRNKFRRKAQQHVLIGKVVNIAATKAMAGYLLQAIERITKEKTAELGVHLRSSWAVSFRRGTAERVIEKINRRRWDMLEAEEKRQAEAVEKARREGSNVETGLTLAGVKEKEDEGNYDFVYGKGAWAERNARRRKAREDQARATAEAEATYTKWAAEHPEEAAKEERRRNAEARSRGSRRGRYRAAPQFKGDWSAYSMGRSAGEKIGIDPQAEGSRAKGELR